MCKIKASRKKKSLKLYNDSSLSLSIARSRPQCRPWGTCSPWWPWRCWLPPSPQWDSLVRCSALSLNVTRSLTFVQNVRVAHMKDPPPVAGIGVSQDSPVAHIVKVGGAWGAVTFFILSNLHWYALSNRYITLHMYITNIVKCDADIFDVTI